jgi:hypothetical protein
MGWRVGLAKDAQPRLFRALVQKEGSSPTYLFHVIAPEAQITKSTSTHQPPHLFSLRKIPSFQTDCIFFSPQHGF